MLSTKETRTLPAVAGDNGEPLRSPQFIISQTNDDPSRHAATSLDDHTLTIDEALARYERAGHPRTGRSIQRYCAKGHLDCLRQETPFGKKYLVTPGSVARHIAQIEELASTTGRDLPRRVASHVAVEQGLDATRENAATDPDTSRYVAADVERVERENEFLRKQIDVKGGQLAVKDKTIEALLERDRETNVLVNQLQKMLARRFYRNRLRTVVARGDKTILTTPAAV